MSQDNDRIRIASIIGGFNKKGQSGTGEQPVREPGIHGMDVLGQNLPHIPRMTRPNAIDSQGLPSQSVILNKLNAGPGSTLSVIAGYIADSPKVGSVPMGTTDIFNMNFTGTAAQDDVTMPLDLRGFESPTSVSRDGVPGKSTLGAKPLIPIDVASKGHHIGQGADDRNVYWEQKNDISTAETPFGSIPSLSMLRGLPGQVLSLASTFKGLTSSQKQRIQAKTTPEMYRMIESNMNDAVDVGNFQTVSLGSRVHQETFSENMVDKLSNCTSYNDLMNCMHDLRSNTELHGKDKLPTVEYKVKSLHGDVGLIIDGHGAYKQNVSAEVAKAQAEFSEFITQGVDQVEILSKFEGQIKANVLSVIHVDFGKLAKGNTYFIEGLDVTDNTHIIKINTGTTDNVGIYYLSETSNTKPNTEMVLYKLKKNPERKDNGGGGGSGLGGMVGMIPGQNMFGEASKLIGEVLPVMNPASSARVKGLLQSLQGQTTKSALDSITHGKPVFAGNAVKKATNIAAKFAGRFTNFKLPR